MEKALQGKLNKRLAELSLLGQVCCCWSVMTMTTLIRLYDGDVVQAHVAEVGSPVVEKHLKAVGKELGLGDVTVTAFANWSVGGK